jgi:hypothetical protein
MSNAIHENPLPLASQMAKSFCGSCVATVREGDGLRLRGRARHTVGLRHTTG